jgi:hypothetical protein
MKIKLYTCLFLLFAILGNAQSNDTLSLFKNRDKLSYKHLIIPTVLIGGGFLLFKTQSNKNIQNDVQNMMKADFDTKVDDYLQFEPILQVYVGRYFGFKPKNDLLHQSINIVIANAIMCAVIKPMKYNFRELRPDLSNTHSFPSGHTATAFTNAAIVFYEYKDSNISYASSGFLFAATTGFLRIANNKHYASDVLVGAGIGLAIGTAVSYWSPFKSLTFGKNKTHTIIYPQLGNNYGVGLLIQQ